MGTLSNTFRTLIKIAGKILFVLGLALNICMIFFGFWPSLIYVLIMLLGAGMVVINKNADTQIPINTVRTSLQEIISSTKKIDGKTIQSAVITAVIPVIAFLGVSVFILMLGQDYFKKRNTINDCKEIITALNFYKKNKNTYPPNLATLISNNPIRASWNKDDWGNPYQYNADNEGTTFILISSGKDGKFYTNDDIVFKN